MSITSFYLFETCIFLGYSAKKRKLYGGYLFAEPSPQGADLSKHHLQSQEPLDCEKFHTNNYYLCPA